MNPFMGLLTAVQLCAAAYELIKGNRYLAALYVCYGVANILLMIIGARVNK